VLLFAVAGGYAAIRTSYYWRYRAEGLAWEQVLFDSAAAGLGFFVIARFAIEFIPRPHWLQIGAQILRTALPFPYAGSVVVGALLGFLTALVSRLFIPEADAIFKAIQEYGGEMRTFLHRAAYARWPVSLTMTNHKVYVGFVVVPPALRSKYHEVMILPTKSGYRDSNTQVVTFTTFYAPIYPTLSSPIAASVPGRITPVALDAAPAPEESGSPSPAAGDAGPHPPVVEADASHPPTGDVGVTPGPLEPEPSKLRPEDFLIVLPLDKIESANRFDDDIYDQNFGGRPQAAGGR